MALSRFSHDAARVVIAPDSFKGSATAVDAAAALAQGWRSVRPQDELVELPVADGGEGTLDAVLAGAHAESRTSVVTLAGGRDHAARWALLGADAVVELAECCGLPLVGTCGPMGVGTEALGVVLGDALDAGARSITLAVGGSASTDGGAGALRALGMRVLDGRGRDVPSGGGGLLHAVRVDRTGLRPPPPSGVSILCDVTAPLFGDRGAAHVFAPQKGADPAQVASLDLALRRWHALLGGAAEAPGAGAAGGTAYGLATAWRARLVPGAATVADAIGLPGAVVGADVVVTGEGRFDAQSLTGKATGLVLDLADRAGARAVVVAGSLGEPPPRGARGWSLTQLAGGAGPAIADPLAWLEVAGRAAACALDRAGPGNTTHPHPVR